VLAAIVLIKIIALKYKTQEKELLLQCTLWP